jgi:hypothetical protein
MPNADRAIPYIPANVNEIKIVMAMQRIGIIVDKYPRASPLIMLIAAPDLHDSANF